MEQSRPIYQIAREINKTWGKVNYSAKPYLEAMQEINKITDKYHYDSGYSVVMYFLANAGTWRGDDARRIKKELNEMMKQTLN